VKGRGAENSVKGALKGEMLQVGSDKMNAVPELWPQVIARGGQHIHRQVYTNHEAICQMLQQFRREPTGAATRIHEVFVTAQS